MAWGDLDADDEEGPAAKRRRRQDASAATAATNSWEAFLQARSTTSQSSAFGAVPTNGFDGFGTALAGTTANAASTSTSSGGGGAGGESGAAVAKEATRRRPWGSLEGEEEGARVSTTSQWTLKLRLLNGSANDEVLEVPGGRRLTAASPVLCALVAKEAAAAAADTAKPGDQCQTATLDLKTMGSSPAALRIALDFALTDDKTAAQFQFWDKFWTKSLSERVKDASPRPVAAASRPGESRYVEEALIVLEVLAAAQALALPKLEDAAEAKLLGGESLMSSHSAPTLISNATVLPMLGHSFGHFRSISKACLSHLSRPGAAREALRGRECQLGVLYATHPVVGTLLSGIYKAAKANEVSPSPGRKPGAAAAPVDPILVDLLCGPGNTRLLSSSSPSMQPVVPCS